MKYIKNFSTLAVALSLALLASTVTSAPALADGEILRLQPAQGKIGDEIEAYSYGLSPGSQYSLYFSDERASVGGQINLDVVNYEYLGQKTASVMLLTAGSFEGFYFLVPDKLDDGYAIEKVRGGTYYVYATLTGSKIIKARAEFTVESVGEIRLNLIKGPVGSKVRITGAGFGNREDIRVEYDGNGVDIDSGDRETSSAGGFECTILIHKSTAGDHTITVIGIESNIKAQSTFTVEPEITISPESGTIGDTVSINGTGFGNRVDFSLSFADARGVTSRTTGDGSFETTFAVPIMGPGSYTITIADVYGNEAEARFTIAATSISLSATTGNVGTGVTISGTGFQANKPISITFDAEKVGTVTTDGYGKFSAAFNVPVHPADTYTVRASDGTNADKASFTILTSASISPVTSTASPGSVGTVLTISGVGFIAGRTVTIAYDGTQVATATVNTSGGFSTTFNAPASRGGQHTIVATDGTTTGQFTFVMESTPPPTPVPLKPEMDIKAETETYFDWEDVSDPSGVTYTLQIANSKDFTTDSIVLEKAGLTRSEYAITKKERLNPVSKEAPYYWHVKTVDGASNASGWSGTGEFYVGGFSLALSKSVIYTLIGIGALILILLAFWLGRKTAMF